MEVILLERVAKLGQMGEVVRVKDGYARNFLLPRGKALRATEANKERFESQRAQLEARNLERRKDAEAVGAKLDGQSFVDHPSGGRIRPALRFGLDARPRGNPDRRRLHVTAQARSSLNTPIKTLGLHKVPVRAAPGSLGEGDDQRRPLAPKKPSVRRAARTCSSREDDNLDDLGLEIGAALAEAGDDDR